MGPPLSDRADWDEIIYWSTLRLADVNGDGRDDLCGRSAGPFQCWLSTGDGEDAIAGPEFSNANGWGIYQFWSMVHCE